MYCDTTVAIVISKDHRVTKGARHFRTKVHYLRETIEMGDVRIEKVDTDDNLADPFTKALAFPKHSKLTEKIRMIPASSLISSKQQHTLSRSSAEAEYRGVSNVVAETAWLRNLLRELHTPLLYVTLVYCDNVQEWQQLAASEEVEASVEKDIKDVDAASKALPR
ncbi:zinc finger, CCHC-type containing protein [Tanacetum coccineum]|uniref:Zinc finger, CCHC-type containing protein n=1 Tax=Tanacetum coccineum TaxID=301880 RepID=A0ABQ4ZRQ8_9ASTR